MIDQRFTRGLGVIFIVHNDGNLQTYQIHAIAIVHAIDGHFQFFLLIKGRVWTLKRGFELIDFSEWSAWTHFIARLKVLG